MRKWLAKIGFDAYWGFLFGLFAVTTVLTIITVVF